MNFKDEFLPIGTVVSFKDKKKKLIITGYLCSPRNDKNTTYDYSGCLYPEGNFSSEKTILFNRNQIDKVYYMGYCDEEWSKLQKKLNEKN